MEQNFTRAEVFKSFAQLLHVLGGKSGVPFFDENEQNTNPYKAPLEFPVYNPSTDVKDFEKLNDDRVLNLITDKDKLRAKARCFHNRIKVARTNTRYLVDMATGLSGGHVTVSGKFFRTLFIEKDGGFIKSTLNALGIKIDVFLQRKVSVYNLEIRNYFEKMSLIGEDSLSITVEEAKLIFKSKDYKMSLSVLIYANPHISAVSFLEGTLPEFINKNFWQEIEKVFKSEIFYLPLEDCFDDLTLEEDENLKDRMLKRKKKINDEKNEAGWISIKLFFILK